jgi:hypothetical protein
MLYDGTPGYGGTYGGATYTEIGADSDFYEPLSPYGRWEVVGAYGRCWVPARVESGWRPYCDGNWVSTDNGWCWESDEPWGWATYHYGRWADHPTIGWCWIPGTQWAPAWVSWCEGDGYIGWAPLGPGERFEHERLAGRGVSSRGYVFVQERRFLDRVRPTTVEPNNAVFINRTVNTTNIRIVNNVVVNEGPRREMIERASGRTVQPVAAREVRREREAPILQRQQLHQPAGGTVVAPPKRGESFVPEMPAVTPPVSHRAPAPAAPATVTPPPTAYREVSSPNRPVQTTGPKEENGPPRAQTRPAAANGGGAAAAPHRVAPATVRVAPTRPPGEHNASTSHTVQPGKPGGAPKASGGQKGDRTQGEHQDKKGEKNEKSGAQAN